MEMKLVWVDYSFNPHISLKQRFRPTVHLSENVWILIMIY